MENLSLNLAAAWGMYLTLATILFVSVPSLKYNLIKSLDQTWWQVIFICICLAIGGFHVYYHQIWTADYKSIITLFGWAALIKGFSLIFFGKSVQNLASNFVEKSIYAFFMLLIFIIGLYLVQIAFTHNII